MIRRAFLTGKENSSAEWEIDSKPTKAQGAIAKMVKTAVSLFFPGAKPGESAGSPPSSLENTAIAHSTTPQHSASAIAIWSQSAARPRMHKSPAMTIAPTERSSSPK